MRSPLLALSKPLALVGAALVSAATLSPALPPGGAHPCDGRWMSDGEIASLRGISLSTLELLKERRGLTSAQVCVIPDDKLRRAIDKAEHPRPDQPDEAMRFRMMSLKDERGQIPPDGLMRAAEQVKAMREAQRPEDLMGPPGAGISRGLWTWLGPGNIGGRIRAILIHPTTPSTIWIGSVSGGIWKTTNDGGTWAPVDDFMANLAVTSLVMDPTNHDMLYAGTGEGFFNPDAIRGAGIFKSIDGGTTWTQLPSTANSSFHYVNRLAISPDGSTILAATNAATWRSTDGGTSWTTSFGARTLDVDFHPTDSTKAIAGRGDGQLFYSLNGGQSWFIRVLGGSRVEVAFAPSNPAIIYASVEQNGGLLYKSTDGGANFSLVNTGTNYLTDNGWYDNALWVDPTNPNVVIVGGIDLWRSTDGGVTLTQMSLWFKAPASAHADHHAIVAHPGFDGTANNTVYFGNDGGIYRADNVYTTGDDPALPDASDPRTFGWQELNNNLGITQFYGAAGSPITGAITGGTQDNGTLFYTTAGGTEGWTMPFGGDGGFSAFDPADPNYSYGEYVFLQIHRSSNTGLTAEYIDGKHWNGMQYIWKAPPYRIDDAMNSFANFIAPFIMDPNEPQRILAGGRSLWRTNDARTATTSTTGPSWSAIKPPNATNSNISAIAVAPDNADVVWVAYGNGDVFKTTNGTSATPGWTRVDNGANPLPNRMATRIAIDPNDADVVYVAFGGFSADNLWKTTDAGGSWSDVTGSGGTGLPDAPVRSIAIHPDNSLWLYAGTEVGIFTSENGGGAWALPHDGPANVSVDEVFFINTSPRKLVAATHGRGIYTIFATTAPEAVVSFTAASSTVNENAGSVTATVRLTTTDGLPTWAQATVNYVTGDVTAAAGSDYTNIPGTLTFPAGTASGTTQTITVPIINDATVEPSEHFSIVLQSSNGASNTPPAAHSVTILDDDTLPNLTIDDVSMSEGNAGTRNFIFTVSSSQAVGRTVSAPFATANGTATASVDYTSTGGVVTFAAGTTTQQVTVVVQGDTAFEPDETFFINLTSPTNASITDGQGLGTIRNDDTFPVGTGDGLYAIYYDNVDFTGSTMRRVDPTVDFAWDAGSPDSAIGPDTFSTHWSGQVRPRLTENYTFYTRTDDGVRLWLGGQLLINKFVDQSVTEWSSPSLPLVAGEKYDIRMEYYENTGGAFARLSWSSPSTPKEVIPQTQLYAVRDVIFKNGFENVPGNNPPTVSISGGGSCHPSPSRPCTVEFVADARDADGDVVTLTWSGCASGGNTGATCIVRAPETHTARVDASDGRGGFARAFATAQGTNLPPRVSFGGSPPDPAPSNTFYPLAGGQPEDPDLDEDPNVICQTATVTASGPCQAGLGACGGVGDAFDVDVHTLNGPGTCTVQAEVRDSWGAVGTDRLEFAVSPP